jgi:hypothetical protein
MFLTREYSSTTLALNTPVDVRLRFGGSAGADYYVAVEDTLPPGFEADSGSLAANLQGEVQSYCLRGDKLSFHINSLGAPMELSCRLIPTLTGSFVAPPARLFPMYSTEKAAFSSSANLLVLESLESEGSGSNGYEAGGAAGPAPAERQDAASVLKQATQAKNAAEVDDGPGEEDGWLPDIRIEMLSVPEQAHPGEMAVFRARLGLSGFQDELPLLVHAFVDGRQVKTESLRLGPDRESFTLNIDWRATAGAHTIRVVADPLGWVDEREEANNALEVPFYVQKTVAPSRPDVLPWQVGFLGLDALVFFVLTVAAGGTARRYIEKRRTSVQRAAGSGQGEGIHSSARP